jgi:eukaryotic-like serine/threonine-protein kinase
MEIHVNHSSYLKYISSYAAVSIAIIECANIIEHQVHLEFPLFKYTLVVIALAFLVGLVFTYGEQKKPDRVRERIKKKFSKWSQTESSRYLLHRSELLNLRVFKDESFPEGFDNYVDQSKHVARKNKLILQLLPWINLALIIIIMGIAGYYFVRTRSSNITIEKDLPNLLSLIDARKYEDAFLLGKQLLEDNSNNKIVEDALQKIVVKTDIRSSPSGVKVFRFAATEESPPRWEYLGKTPLLKVQIPWSKFTKLKFDAGNNREFIFSEAPWILNLSSGMFNLPLEAKIDTNTQALVIGQNMKLFIPGLDEREATVQPYAIDKYEVTNEEYQTFVNANGYLDSSYWDLPYKAKDKVFTFSDVKTTFTDRTGLCGPASWLSGSFPEGKGKLPVNGISWFEAAAYARFKGKSLPSVYHWTCASTVYMGSEIIPASNFSKVELKEAGHSSVRSVYGLSDVGGNVREWCTNASGPDSTHKAILGGSYMDDPYSFNDFFAQDPFDRSLANGFRCIMHLNRNTADAAKLDEYLYVPLRDYKKLPKVSKEAFGIIKRQYDYEKKPLEAKSIKKIQSNADYNVEVVEFNVAYNDERMLGYLYTPKVVTSKPKMIIHFPGANAFNENLDALNKLSPATEFLVRQNYALFIPVYKSTYNRVDDVKNDYPNQSDSFKEHIIMWGKDMRRSIDYLETRQDLDISKLAYYGISWGGAMGGILCAIDDRIKVGVLYVAGFYQQQCQLEVEQYVYTPYITMPIIMLNGKYDFFFPLETSQNPMFELLGTPAEDKKRYVYETGHNVPEENLIKETLAWLEKYTQ